MKKYLKALKVSQAEMARRLGVTPTTMCAWCKDENKIPGIYLKYLELYCKHHNFDVE